MSRRLITLNFHGIGDASRWVDPAEKRVWLTPSDFQTILDAAAERADVLITFDDGNRSDLETALPALIDRGLRATFFVVAGRLGEPGFLDEPGVRMLAAAGMGIGSHGMRHRPWRGLDEAALHAELVEARRQLEAVVGAPVTEAACPFGSYDRHTLQVLRQHRYTRVYTSDGGTTVPDHWIQTRNTCRAGDDASLVDRIVASERAPARLLRQRASRLVKRWR